MNTIAFDKEADKIAKQHQREIAHYMGEYNGLRTYVLTFKAPQNSCGGLPPIIQATNSDKPEFTFVEGDDLLNVIAYFAEQAK